LRWRRRGAGVAGRGGEQPPPEVGRRLAELGRAAHVKGVGEHRQPPGVPVGAGGGRAQPGAVAVIERPIRPFGLLTNLTIARSLWLERRDADKRMRKLERKLAGIQRIQKAKVILMDGQGLNEAEAYESIRRQAMSKRLSMDDMAAAIIHANELLQYRVKGD